MINVLFNIIQEEVDGDYIKWAFEAILPCLPCLGQTIIVKEHPYTVKDIVTFIELGKDNKQIGQPKIEVSLVE